MAIPYTRAEVYQYSNRTKKLVDNIFDYDPLIMKLLQKAEVKSGNSVQHPVEYAKSTQRGWYSPMQTLHTADEETDTMTNLEWKAAEVSVPLSNFEIAKNQGATRVLDLEARAWEKAERNMVDQLCTSVYSDGTGSSSKEIVGLKAAIDDGTNTDSYAGINRDDETWWQSYYSNAAANLSLDIIRAAYSATTTGTKTPQMIVTSKTEFDAYENLLDANVRYSIMQSGGNKKMTKSGSGLTGEAGFEYLMYRNTPIVASDYIDAGYMYLLNLDSIHWNFMKHPKFKNGKYGFSESPDMTPHDQDGSVKRIHTYCCMTVDELRRNGKIIGLTD